MTWRIVGGLLGFALSLTGITAAAAQQPQVGVGTVTGQVIAADSRLPLGGAQVSVVGTTLGATAGAEGRFTIRSVPAGARTLRVRLVGYAPLERAVTVTAGGTVRADFAMIDEPVHRTHVVVHGRQEG